MSEKKNRTKLNAKQIKTTYDGRLKSVQSCLLLQWSSCVQIESCVCSQFGLSLILGTLAGKIIIELFYKGIITSQRTIRYGGYPLMSSPFGNMNEDWESYWGHATTQTPQKGYGMKV